RNYRGTVVGFDAHPTLARRGERMHRTNRVPRAPLGGLLLLGLLFGGGTPHIWAQGDTAPRRAPEAIAGNATKRLQMCPRKDGSYPKIANVVNDKENILRITQAENDPFAVLGTGLLPGTARVTFTSDKNENETIEVVVELDVELLRRLLRQSVPTAQVTVIP